MTPATPSSGAVGNAASSIDQAAWPITKAERHFTRARLAIVLLVASAATWCYLTGEVVARYLDFKMGFAALLAGSLFGMCVAVLAVVPAATRYGIDTMASSKPLFGDQGWIFSVLLQFLSIVGWNSLLLIFFGKSVAILLSTMGLTDPANSPVIVRAVSGGACVLVFLLLMHGMSAIERASGILFALIVGIGIWIGAMLITGQSDALAKAVPKAASDNLLWNYTTGIEIGIASHVAWWPYLGAMVRESPDAKTATLPAILAMGLPVPLLGTIGIAATLALEVADPSAWLVQLGGALYGAIALIFLIAANLGTTTVGAYATAIGMKQVPVLKGLSWRTTVLIGLAPVAAICTIVPDLFFDNLGSFLAFVGVLFSPVCAIQIADHMILRRQRLDLRALYVTGPGTAYHYWRGINPAGVIAMLTGFAVYIALLNPLTYESRFPYEWTTASIPAGLASGLVYWLVTRLVIIPNGKGGYRKVRAAP